MNTSVNSRRKSKKLMVLGGLALLAVALVALALIQSKRAVNGPGHSGGARSSQFAGPQPVRAAAAVKGDIPITITALGTVTPLASVTVRPQVNGQLMQLAFTEGQVVQKGAFLAEIDPRPYQVQLEQAEGALAKDQGLLGQAQSDLKRFQSLAPGVAISEQQLDDQVYLVQQYQGAVKADQAQVDNAKLNLTYCHVTAPVTGRVGLRQVNVGNYVQTADTGGLVVITQSSPISVIFSLPEDDIPQVLKRVNAGAKLPVTLYDRDNAAQVAEGALTAVDNMVNTTTGTVQLRAVFQNSDGRLFPNDFVNVRLRVDTLEGATLVPAAAVQHGAPGAFVYVVGSDNTVSLRAVTTGAADADQVAVLSGLKPGEQVVTDGAEQLKDGAQVSLPQANSPSSASASTPAPAASTGAAKRGDGKKGSHRHPPSSGGS